MLSKLLSPGAMEKHLARERSKMKENLDKTNESKNSDEGTAKNVNGVTSSCNSNWEKFRSVVSEQHSSKRHHSHPPKTRGTSGKTAKMIIPESQTRARKSKSIVEHLDGTDANDKLTKQIAIDCEMVGIGDKSESMLARVSLVNRHGVCVYDKYVKPREKISDYRTAVSGIHPHHLADGEDFEVVQAEVAEILKGRLLIGHALKNDLRVLFLSHPKRNLRDTSHYRPFKKVTKGNTPSLKKLASELLGVDIQDGEHNSIEDAQAAMQLYVLYKNQWENEIYSKR